MHSLVSMMPKTKHILRSSENICRQQWRSSRKRKYNNNRVLLFLFWFVRFLFVLSELQVVDRPEWMRERERSQTLSKATMDGQKEKKSRGERKCKILVLRLCATYRLLFFPQPPQVLKHQQNLFAKNFFHCLVNLNRLIYPIINPILV